MKVFISYPHEQSQWVWDRLVPCLAAGGVHCLVDREQFEVGKAVFQQMDALQDEADKHILVLDQASSKSKACLHEMRRAVAKDPKFRQGLVLALRRDRTPLPAELAPSDPALYVNLTDDRKSEPWRQLMAFTGGELGTAPTHWLESRDELRHLVRSGISASLLVKGRVEWRGLLEHLCSPHDPKGSMPPLPTVDMDAGSAASRRGLVQEILGALSLHMDVPPENEDLVVLCNRISAAPRSYLVLRHFDRVKDRPHYGTDLFSAFRHLVRDKRKLVLILQSRNRISSLIPSEVLESSFIDVHSVELVEQP